MPPTKCDHDKTRSSCKICTPSNFCPCGRLKRQCKDCGGSSVCFDHGTVRRLKSDCLECHPEKACEHGKLSRICYKCNNHLRCECGKLKYNCHLHSPGDRFCEHKRFRSQCRDCIIASMSPAEAVDDLPSISSSTLCPHEKRPTNCRICNESTAKRWEVKNAIRVANRLVRQKAEEPYKDILEAIQTDVKAGMNGAAIRDKYGPILASRRADLSLPDPLPGGPD